MKLLEKTLNKIIEIDNELENYKEKKNEEIFELKKNYKKIILKMQKEKDTQMKIISKKIIEEKILEAKVYIEEIEKNKKFEIDELREKYDNCKEILLKEILSLILKE